MRAVAVLLVVFSHAGFKFIPGGAGVTIFFVISGFIITHLLLREQERAGTFDIVAFYVRRLFKLAPPFLLLVLIPTSIYALANNVEWSKVSSQVFFAYNWVKIGDGVESSTGVLPGSGVVWSLAIEEQFYIVFALVWLVFATTHKSRRLVLISSSIFALTPLALRFMFVNTGTTMERIYYGTDTRIDAIAIGALSATIFAIWREKPERIQWIRMFGNPASLILSCSLLLATFFWRDTYFRDTARYSLQALAAAAILLYGLLASDGKIFKIFSALVNAWPFQIIGLASYSLYLLHDILLQWWNTNEASVPAAISLSLISILAGCVAWIVIERPAEVLKSNWSRRRFKRKRIGDGVRA